MSNRLIVPVVFAVGVALLGCGSTSDMPTVPVSGTITFAGGACPEWGSITFMPHSGSSPAGIPARPGAARFDRDGKFVVTSFHEGDGLVPGTYGVSISCIKGQLNLSNPNAMAEQSYVPQDYRPENLVVEQGQGPIEINYDVPPKKSMTQ